MKIVKSEDVLIENTLRDMLELVMSIYDYKRIEVFGESDTDKIIEKLKSENIDKGYFQVRSEDVYRVVGFIKKTNLYDLSDLYLIGGNYFSELGIKDITFEIDGDNAELTDLLNSLDTGVNVKSGKDLCISAGNERLATLKVSEDYYYIEIDCSNVLKQELLVDTQDKLNVYVIPEKAELNSDAYIIGSDLRMAGFTTEIDFSESDVKEKIENAKKRNATYVVTVTEKELKKYSVLLLDTSLNEVKKIKINNLADELYMNL